jgi:cell cycle arrest protein BUB3
VCVWDPRLSNPLLHKIPQADKVYSMDICSDNSSGVTRLLVATAARHIDSFDMKNLPRDLQKRDSSMKFQTRAIKCFPDGQGEATIVCFLWIRLWLCRGKGLSGLF